MSIRSDLSCILHPTVAEVDLLLSFMAWEGPLAEFAERVATPGTPPSVPIARSTLLIAATKLLAWRAARPEPLPPAIQNRILNSLRSQGDIITAAGVAFLSSQRTPPPQPDATPDRRGALGILLGADLGPGPRPGPREEKRVPSIEPSPQISISDFNFSNFENTGDPGVVPSPDLSVGMRHGDRDGEREGEGELSSEQMVQFKELAAKALALAGEIDLLLRGWDRG